ncbi:MAG: CDP-diacylglycerol--glycerol-3-phosphate 3-phosphatidyltransferase [Deltaproteobacteria bacterium]|nr:CDP-diacylglycerol--glycerol-3-phosphate 3-phosphatidyltransferase [Deltaproteobacteria bacterium]
MIGINPKGGIRNNLPNILSLIRIGATPILILMLLDPGKVLSILATILFLVVALTDWLDGYLARRMGLVTRVGKFLDPLADKLLIISALIMLISLDRAPAWMVTLIVAREIAVTGLRTMALEAGVVISASIAGKTKTVFQIAAVVPLLIHYPFFGIEFQYLGEAILWLAFILTIYSGVEYFIKFNKHEQEKGSSSAEPDSSELGDEIEDNDNND